MYIIPVHMQCTLYLYTDAMYIMYILYRIHNVYLYRYNVHYTFYTEFTIAISDGL